MNISQKELVDAAGKNKKRAKVIEIALAIVAPPLLGTLTAELYYVCHFKGPWIFYASYALPQIVALFFLFRALHWQWWIKGLVAIPFLALSLAVTVYACLIVAAANGDGL
jgi:hypothetical protein